MGFRVMAFREKLASRIHKNKGLYNVVKSIMIVHHEFTKAMNALSKLLQVNHPA
jgi:hypothetical protein